jgi:ACS family hexuronate transporter-like MFS transporter
VLNWGAKYLVREHGLTQLEVGSYLWLPPVFFDVGAIGFGHFASKNAAASGGRPQRGLFAMAAVLSMAMVAMPFTGGPWSAIVVAGIAMAGGGGLFALLTADMLMRVSPRVVSSAGGISAAAQSLAYIVANPLVGASVQRTGSYTTMIVALSLWVLPGCVAWLVWRPPPAWRYSTTTS